MADTKGNKRPKDVSASSSSESESDDDDVDAKRAAAAAEWAAVEQRQQNQLLDPALVAAEADNMAKRNFITFESALSYFGNLDLSEQRTRIVPEIPIKGVLSSLYRFLFGPPKLKSAALIEERNFLFCIAKVGLKDCDQEIHMHMLMTIYNALLGDDPGTDLRGVGMLGALHLLYFVLHHRECAEAIFLLSQDATQNFPFAVFGLNWTRLVLESLQEGCVSAAVNSAGGSLIDMTNTLYCAIYYHMFLVWRKGKTVMDSGFVLKQITQTVKKKPQAVLAKFYKDVVNKKNKK